MQRYYKNARTNTHENSRSNRNKNLYGEIYTYGKYSNIEGIASIDNAFALKPHISVISARYSVS